MSIVSSRTQARAFGRWLGLQLFRKVPGYLGSSELFWRELLASDQSQIPARWRDVTSRAAARSYGRQALRFMKALSSSVDRILASLEASKDAFIGKL